MYGSHTDGEWLFKDDTMSIQWLASCDYSRASIVSYSNKITPDYIGDRLSDECHGISSHDTDGQLTGWLMMYPDDARKYVVLEWVAVASDCRRDGIATALVERVKAWLGGDYDTIVAFVDETNLDAQLFFRSLGFKATFYERECGNITMKFREADGK